MVRRKSIKDGDLIQIYIHWLKKYTLVSFKDYSTHTLLLGGKDLLWFVFYCWDYFSDIEIEDSIDIEDLNMLSNPILCNGNKNLLENWSILRDNEVIDLDIHLTMEYRTLGLGLNDHDISIYEKEFWHVFSPEKGKWNDTDLHWNQVSHLESFSLSRVEALEYRILYEYFNNYDIDIKLEDLDEPEKYYYEDKLIRPLSKVDKKYWFRHLPK